MDLEIEAVMINRKSRDEIKRMRHAGHIVALVHKKMREVVEPGISTKELDNIAMKVIKENKAIPTFLGYSGFPASICTRDFKRRRYYSNRRWCNIWRYGR